ncbi:hypothetical protein FRC08_007990 [Ceratobasidium sp. 394]|nr:hypothetical protein FRC08_007990 [Ceratobasidium sp. 394]
MSTLAHALVRARPLAGALPPPAASINLDSSAGAHIRSLLNAPVTDASHPLIGACMRLKDGLPPCLRSPLTHACPTPTLSAPLIRVAGRADASGAAPLARVSLGAKHMLYPCVA